MTVDLLDRSIWHGLATRQAKHAADQSGGQSRARRFHPEIGPFAAMVDDSAESLAALAELVEGDGDSVALLQWGESPVPPGLTIEMAAPGVQMILDQPIAPPTTADRIEKLTEADAPEMLALALLTEPGPFRARTHQLGTFWGIKHDGRLVAMAGERFQPIGFTEVSGVCTHPDARGRGHAGVLSRHVASLIQARGETPFLHAWAGNTNAIRLYEALGFRLRREMVVTMLRRSD